jgi:transposase-like protein
MNRRGISEGYGRNDDEIAVNLLVVPHLSSQGNERHRAPLPQGASHQGCQFHHAKNLLGMAGFDERAELAEGLRGIFAAPNRELALQAAEDLHGAAQGATLARASS